MIITSTPSKFHAAFNPIIFEVEPSDSTERDASLSVYDENGKLITALARAFYGNTTKFDVSSVISKLFDTVEPVFTNGMAVDKRLFVKYKVAGSSYFAINAAVDMGNTSSFAGQISVILSRFSGITLYAGYPADISVLVNTSFGGLTAEAVNRIQDIANFLENVASDMYLIDNSGDYILDNFLNYIILERAGAGLSGKKFTVENGCIPVNPFYVRWINDVGGIDYWMFSVYQELKTSLKSSSTFRKFYTDTEAERGSAVIYAQEAEDAIKVGSDHLSDEQYKALSMIPYSPLIEWYNEITRKWVRLTVDKEDNTKKTVATKQSIEITFILPQRNLQV